MRVNLITETSWILGRCAKELHNRLGWSINSKEPADVDYHLPYWRGINLDRDPGIRVGFFTHGFNRARSLVGKFDAVVCMNLEMLQITTVENGIGCRRPAAIVLPGVDAPARMPVFGVAGRTYSDGRKGQDLVRKAVNEGYDFLSLGPGPWPCESAGADPTRNTFLGFWNKIDYFVVTSTDEGGPIPALEAIAHRVPVIAPDVGFCWELPVIRYECGNWESLKAVLHDLTITPTWAEWAEQHGRFFEGIWKQRKEAAA